MRENMLKKLPNVNNKKEKIHLLKIKYDGKVE
jgi:hypothetical protein